MPRKKLIAANWKMYKTCAEAQAFVSALLPLVAGHTRDEIALCVPYTCLETSIAAARGSAVEIGAQNMHWEREGAFTGEISAAMLKCLGCQLVIIGHSERRQYFAETDEIVQKKVRTAMSEGMRAIICVGERLEEREAAQTEAVLVRQLAAALRDASAAEVP